MKKSIKIIICVSVALIVGLVCMYFVTNPPADTEEKFFDKINNLSFFSNSTESSYPQTEIYNIIKSHFESELPQGKTAKKAILIGYDGCRLDALTEIQSSDGAMKYVTDNGGVALKCYCGGVAYPEKNTQQTSTAPGWCSILTGQWADVHGITDNDIVKSNDHLSLLTTLVEDKTINSSAFYTSWDGHFSTKKSTYSLEVEYAKEKGLNETFAYLNKDEETKEAVLADISQENCNDFIFSIFEQCDHSGHSKGFFTEKESYKKAFKEADQTALDVIKAIESRETFEKEDWLIILTSDHGGKGRGHGNESAQERFTFLFCNKNIDISD